MSDTDATGQTPPAASPLSAKAAESDRHAWQDFWSRAGQPWRTEPEISPARQAHLETRRHVVANISAGIYPLAQLDPPLARADVEWLLATHEAQGIVGPVRFSEEMTYRRSLDLRGADLRGLDLSGLPLAYSDGGLDGADWEAATPEQRAQAAVQLQGATLDHADLQFCHYSGALLTGASLQHAQLDYATLISAHLEKCDLRFASLRIAQLRSAFLEYATLTGAYLRGANLRHTHGDGVDATSAVLESVDGRSAQWERACLRAAHLDDANLSFANLREADLTDAHFKRTVLFRADLSGAILHRVNLEEADLRKVIRE